MTKPKQDNTKLTILGENISANESCTSSGSIIWGLLLIFLGIILLLNTLGTVSWEIWLDIIKYWPILLILAGVNIILGDSKISNFIFSLFVAIIFMLIFTISISNFLPEFFNNLPIEIQDVIKYLQEMTK